MNFSVGLPECVVPIYRHASPHGFAGTGFFIDGCLVTAGHVLRRGDLRLVFHDGKYIRLHADRWVPPLVGSDDMTGFDVAFYPVPQMKSTLRVADFYDERPDDLQLMCWQFRGGQVVRVVTPGVVTGRTEEDGYFKLATVERVLPGCSGCPVFDSDGLVHGIVTMVNAEFKLPQDMAGTLNSREKGLMQTMGENTCWVFDAQHIRQFLPK